MAINFKEKIKELKQKDIESLTKFELGYIKVIEEYIDSQIEAKLSTDKSEVMIDKVYIDFEYNPVSKTHFPAMTSKRKSILREELLNRYKKANWEIDYHIDDGLDGPNMSGGDYLILKGKL